MTANNQVAEANVKYLAEANGKLRVENGELKDLSHSRLPKGYKQTEVGVIPEDWESVPLHSMVLALEAGVSVNSVDKPNAFTHGKHILKTSCVDSGYFYAHECKSILASDLNRAKTTPVAGSIIVSRMNTPELVGELGYVEQDCPDAYLPDRLWQMKFLKDIALNTRWLAYILSFPTIARKIKDAATGTSNSMKNISKGSLLSLTVPTPKPNEQTAIAKALSDVDALINELEKLIAKKQAIKIATMQQLLTGRIRLTSGALKIENGKRKNHSQFSTLNSQLTKQSELGEIPEDWEVKNIGQLFTITAGGDLRKNEYSADQTEIYKYPIFSNAISNKGLYGYCTTYDYCGSYLTITARGGIGHAIARTNEFCAIGRLLVLKPTSYSSCKFFEEFINQYIEFANESTGVPQLTAPQVAKYSVIVPDEKEQNAIATILSDMDAEIQTLQQRLAKTRQIKQGMMQELLTGKTRLINGELKVKNG